MSRKLIILGIFAAALPVSVDRPGSIDDSTGTDVSLAAGGGSYALVTRGCEGNVLTKDELPFRDIGGSVEHRFPGHYRVGVRAGALEEGHGLERDNVYVNPNLSVDWRRASLGVGGILSKHMFTTREGDSAQIPISAHLRVGSMRKYLALSFMEDVPLYSAGGYLDATLGFRRWGSDIQIGANFAGPYDRPGGLLRVSAPLGQHLWLDAKGRLGESQNLTEWGAAVGMTWRGGTRKSRFTPPATRDSAVPDSAVTPRE